MKFPLKRDISLRIMNPPEKRYLFTNREVSPEKGGCQGIKFLGIIMKKF